MKHHQLWKYRNGHHRQAAISNSETSKEGREKAKKEKRYHRKRNIRGSDRNYIILSEYEKASVMAKTKYQRNIGGKKHLKEENIERKSKWNNGGVEKKIIEKQGKNIMKYQREEEIWSEKEAVSKKELSVNMK